MSAPLTFKDREGIMIVNPSAEGLLEIGWRTLGASNTIIA